MRGEGVYGVIWGEGRKEKGEWRREKGGATLCIFFQAYAVVKCKGLR